MAAREPVHAQPAPGAVPHARSATSSTGRRSRCWRRARGSASPAPSSSTSSIPATACRSSGSGRSASSTATGAAASATTRAPARCSTRSMPLATERAGGLAWEYLFPFDGQNAAVGLLARPGHRACRRWRAPRRGCKRQADVFPVALRGLGIFQTAPPAGVRVPARQRRPLPAVLGPAAAVDPQRLHPVARRALRLRGADRRRRPRAALFDDGDRAARKEVADVRHRRLVALQRAARSRRESDLGYHKLLRDFLVQLCTRTTDGRVLRRRAALHGLPDDAAGARGAPAHARRAQEAGKLRFKLSKISRIDADGQARRARSSPRSPPACSGAGPRRSTGPRRRRPATTT